MKNPEGKSKVIKLPIGRCPGVLREKSNDTVTLLLPVRRSDLEMKKEMVLLENWEPTPPLLKFTKMYTAPEKL